MLGHGLDHEREVWTQLGRVTDPELDQSVTELDFIDEVDVADRGDVRIRFRLPTYWCAANFAFMMGQDMKEVVGELPWVERLQVQLLDHFYADSINRGLAENASFEQTCGGEAQGGLDLLRATFRRKAFYGRQERLIEHLRVRLGYRKGELVAMRVADLAALDMACDEAGSHLRDRYLEMRRRKAPDVADETSYRGDAAEFAFVSADGQALTEDGLGDHLRHVRSVRLNSEFNANLCGSVLAARKQGRGRTRQADLGPIRLVGEAASQ